MAAEPGNQYAVGNEGGRPTKYKNEYANQAYKLCLLGFTDKDMAFYFEVDEQTITNWKRSHKEFLGAVKAGKSIADANVAESFYKRANGYYYDEVTFEKTDPLIVINPEEIKVDVYKKKIVTKHLPPDAGAALNWLKNRQRDLWRDKHTLEIGLEQLTESQLDQIIKELKAGS